MRRSTLAEIELNSTTPSITGGPAGSNLTFRIMEDLGIAIVTGRYSESNPFPIEASLCEKYGVSRSVCYAPDPATGPGSSMRRIGTSSIQMSCVGSWSENYHILY